MLAYGDSFDLLVVIDTADLIVLIDLCCRPCPYSPPRKSKKGRTSPERGLTFIVAHQLLHLAHPDWYVAFVPTLHPDRMRSEALFVMASAR